MLKAFATSIVQTLRQRGYQAYLVGGCVRDLLLGRDPKDYDVATDATPAGPQRRRSVTELLGRTLPDGNGDSFYNIDPPAGTTIGWMKALGSWLGAGRTSATPGFNAVDGGLEAGGDLAEASDHAGEDLGAAGNGERSLVAHHVDNRGHRAPQLRGLFPLRTRRRV